MKPAQLAIVLLIGHIPSIADTDPVPSPTTVAVAQTAVPSDSSRSADPRHPEARELVSASVFTPDRGPIRFLSNHLTVLQVDAP